MDGKRLSRAMSPISNFPDDILTSIFQINSGESDQLSLLLAGSQVCQNWRELLLNSPIIWGQCIHLDVLKHGNTEWREEVLRRTQTAPLWIVGDIPSSALAGHFPLDIQRYFSRLLKSWERVQKLDVTIRGREIPEDIQNAFLSAAPILDVFAVYLPDVRENLFLSTLLPNSTNSLFANHAPSLTEIRAGGVAFRTDATWLANLRTILLSYGMPDRAKMELLSRTPLLEKLYIRSSGNGWTSVDKLSCRVNLPYLSEMKIFSNSLANCVIFMDCISPPKSCFWEIHVGDKINPISTMPPHAASALKEALPAYISNYFNTHISTDIRLQLDADGFRLQDLTRRPSQRLIIEIYDKLAFELYEPDTLVPAIRVFAASDILSPSLFNTVTTLTINMGHVPESGVPYLYAMLLLFQSVENLITTEDDLHSILFLSQQPGQLQNDGQLQHNLCLFPNIHTLSVTSLLDHSSYINEQVRLLKFIDRRRNVGVSTTTFDFTTCARCRVYTYAEMSSLGPFVDDEYNGDFLLHFLVGRKSQPVGRPVLKLDLTSCAPQVMRDFSPLEIVDGLEVLWNSRSGTARYICGSGKAEKLRFDRRQSAQLRRV